MHSQASGNLTKIAMIPLVALLSTVGAWAQTDTVLYSFTGQPDGAYPKAGLLRDPKGNLFGTTNSCFPELHIDFHGVAQHYRAIRW